ncbi:antibiotic biosynthesis monooxygenase [Mesobacillus foraminis]|uniref:antibiotic biosynthesis monooxygenase family protein n=1 Tax=Mesobacillus foraminis TaxID=279826 RepID=UPI001BE64451|nr:antibiotic biosynthesis monooxygenase [Mesobacillus foraminis]MBT2759404.1 antibiotic biosynthesis monooxygenase [Mesobacillus foraminis]
MNAYITTGTLHFLKKIKDKHPGEKMVLMGHDDSAALLHETSGETVFASPRKYEVIDSTGTFENAGYAVLNNIPVTDEGRPLFEYRFSNRPGQVEKEPGFIALRVLRPLSSNTYIILTLWEAKSAFDKWQLSNASKEAHQEKGQPSTIFSGAPYITTYSIAEEE